MYYSKCGSKRAKQKVMGEFPSGQRGQTVNLLSDDFGGSNPPSPTRKKPDANVRQAFSLKL